MVHNLPTLQAEGTSLVGSLEKRIKYCVLLNLCGTESFRFLLFDDLCTKGGGTSADLSKV